MNLKIGILFLISIYTQNTPSFAGGSKAPPKLPQEYTDTETTPFELSPQNIRRQSTLLNRDVLKAANQVHRAKNSLDLARARLLPSLDLGTLLFSGGSPTFLVAGVEILLPFLLPSRWFEAAEAELLLKADLQSFRALQLNTFASSLSLAYAFENDFQLWNILKTDEATYQELFEITLSKHRWGLVTDSDLALAKARLLKAQLAASRVELLLKDLESMLKRALALNPQRALVPRLIDKVRLPEESRDAADLLPAALDTSPEWQQVKLLLQASQNQSWARGFGFMRGFSLGFASNPGGNAQLSFDRAAGSGFFEIGFDRIPLIELSQRNTDELVIRQTELKEEILRILSLNLEQLPILDQRTQNAKLMEEELRKNFERILQQYRLGQGLSFDTVLLAQSDIQLASLDWLKARTEASLTRINIERTLVMGEFSEIKGCGEPKDCLGPSLKAQKP